MLTDATLAVKPGTGHGACDACGGALNVGRIYYRGAVVCLREACKKALMVFAREMEESER